MLTNVRSGCLRCFSQIVADTPSSNSERQSARRWKVSARYAAGCLIAIVLQGFNFAEAAYFKPLKAYPDGWDATVLFGAQATRGASRTSSLSGASEATYRGGRWETLFEFKALNSSSSVAVNRHDENGEPATDALGEPIMDIVRKRTNDRRFVSLQPRWSFRAERNYLFSIIDYETNTPADIQSSTRQIVGIGYRLWRDKSNYLTAGIGVGRKRLERESGDVDEGGIGYLGLSFVRKLGERARFEARFDSDFGGENRFTELDFGFTWKLASPVAIKLGYEARQNSDFRNAENPFDESVDARATLSLEIDVL